MFPDTWEGQDTDEPKYILLDKVKHKEEYESIEGKFMETIKQQNIKV
jgi:hypothetical protein